eukprot:gene8892-1594_t
MIDQYNLFKIALCLAILDCIYMPSENSALPALPLPSAAVAGGAGVSSTAAPNGRWCMLPFNYTLDDGGEAEGGGQTDVCLGSADYIAAGLPHYTEDGGSAVVPVEVDPDAPDYEWCPSYTGEALSMNTTLGIILSPASHDPPSPSLMLCHTSLHGLFAACRFPSGHAVQYSASLSTFTKTSALWSAVLGQVFFGLLADRFGRKRCFVATLVLVSVGAIGAGVVWPIGGNVSVLFGLIGAFEAICGFGIGGEYPLSAAVSLEKFNDFKAVSYTFSMQGVGMVVAHLVVLGLLAVFGQNPDNLEWVWRIAIGVFPFALGTALLPFRLRMHETNAFVQDVQQDSEKAGLMTLLNKDNILSFIGCAGSWFLFDVAFYGNALIAPDAVNFIFGGTTLMDTVMHSFAVALVALPGYYAGILFLHKVDGLWLLQMVGFSMTTLLYGLFFLAFLVLGYGEVTQYPAFLLSIYSLSYFFINCGPNLTTFILPVVLFPTRIRASAHGLSAAFGKIGGVVGVALFEYIKGSMGLQAFPMIMAMCCGCCLAGLVLTALTIPRSAGKTLEIGDASVDFEELQDMQEPTDLRDLAAQSQTLPRQQESEQTEKALPQTPDPPAASEPKTGSPATLGDEHRRQVDITLDDGSVYKGGYVGADYHGYGVLQTKHNTYKACPSASRYALISPLCTELYLIQNSLTMKYFQWNSMPSLQGEWKAGMRHGKGRQQCPEHTYDGEWRDDRFNGTGFLKFSDGSIQQGFFVEGMSQAPVRAAPGVNSGPKPLPGTGPAVPTRHPTRANQPGAPARTPEPTPDPVQRSATYKAPSSTPELGLSPSTSVPPLTGDPSADLKQSSPLSSLVTQATPQTISGPATTSSQRSTSVPGQFYLNTDEGLSFTLPAFYAIVECAPLSGHHSTRSFVENALLMFICRRGWMFPQTEDDRNDLRSPVAFPYSSIEQSFLECVKAKEQAGEVFFFFLSGRPLDGNKLPADPDAYYRASDWLAGLGCQPLKLDADWWRARWDVSNPDAVVQNFTKGLTQFNEMAELIKKSDPALIPCWK